MDEQREAETWLRLGGSAQNQSYGDEAILFFFCHSPMMPPVFRHCFFFCSDRWRETSSYSRHPRRSIWLSLSAFSGGLFYSLINWDLTPPPRLHLSVSLHDNQLTHVQTPSGNPPSSSKETETKDTEAVRLNTRLQRRDFPPPVPQPSSRAAKG